MGHGANNQETAYKALEEVNAHDLAATFLDKARECGFHVDGENGNLEMGTVKAEVKDLKGDTCDCCDAAGATAETVYNAVSTRRIQCQSSDSREEEGRDTSAKG